VNFAVHRRDGDELDPDRYQLELFDVWTVQFLDEVSAAHRPVVARFLRWGLRRRLLRAAALGALRPWSCRGARMQARRAWDFLQWLESRRLTLDTCAQADLDAWFADGPTTRHLSAAFITWAIQHRLCDRRLRLPVFKSAAPTPMPDAQRVELIGRLIRDATLRLDDRVAGLLVTLYAQTTTRISRLRLDDISHDADGAVELDLGGEPVQVVAPLDGMLVELATRRTSTDVWLIPGRTPDRPLNPKTLAERLSRLGVTRPARVAALHDLIREVPGPVLAPLIGYNPNFVADRAATLAVAWATYPALRTRT
jgi:hypothetical protein